MPTTAPDGRRRLRIAHVNDVAAVGSVLAQAMTDLGEDACVVSPRRFAPGLRYPWRAATLPLRGGALLGAAMSVRLRRFDVVHLHYARFGFMGPLSGRPYVLHLHGTDIRGVRPGTWWARETEPFIRRARLVYYATPDLEEWVRPFRSEATFLPNPIDTDLFRPLAAGDPARATRRDLLVGVRLDPVKGASTIVEIVRLLAAERPKTSVTIVAQGAALVEARAAAGPNTEVVARVPRERLPELLRGHRLALGQFLVGAAGNYELEALASGVPVVMRFDHQGVYPSAMPIVNVRDAAQATRRICELLDDGTELGELAGRGPAWVEATHAARTVAARVLADYRAVGLDRR